jgi:hypothetical protein
MRIIGMIGLRRLKLFDRVAFQKSFEFHGFKYFLDKNFTVTQLHEWYQLMIFLVPFFYSATSIHGFTRGIGRIQ